MSERTIHLHRVLRCPPQRLYRAFTEAGAMAKWLPPHGFTCQVHHLEARVGGSFRMSFHNFGSGGAHAFHGEYLELVPGELIRYTDQFEDPSLPGVLEVTVRLQPMLCGTDLRITHNRLGDNSRPMMNNSNTTPSSEIWLTLCGLPIRPSTDGPMITPANR